MIWRRGRTDGDPLAAYTERLLRLHQLIAAGEGDSEQADKLRDEMDAPWSNLKASQVRLVDGLSEDLYSSNAATAGTIAETTSPPDFQAAVDKADWVHALDVIRNACLQPQDFLRGVCWAHLGQPKVAAEFFDRAAQRGDLSAEQEWWRLISFTQAGRGREVLDRARDITSQETDPILRFAAGHVLFELAAQGFVDHPEAIDATNRTLELVRQSAVKDPALLSQDLIVQMQSFALLNLAFSYDELGDRVAATEACREALKISPEDMHALLLLGWLNADSSNATHESLRGELRRALFESSPLSTANM